MTNSSDYWEICADLDSAEEAYNAKCKRDQLHAWKVFQISLNDAIRSMETPAVYVGNLSPHQIESIQQSDILKSRFRISIEDKHCYLNRL